MSGLPVIAIEYVCTWRGLYREVQIKQGGITLVYYAFVLGIYIIPLTRAFLFYRRTFDLIKINNLTKIFGSNDTKVDAVKNISIDIDKGDIYGIIGMSGAGKSTLLRCIGLLEQPTSGSIEIDGVNTNQYIGKDLINLRKEVGIIFQGYHLLMQKNVRKNIAFPLEISNVPKDEIDKRVDEILKFVDLSDKANAYPSQLSGGQKQRVAIARALVNNSKVLLCDEPTSALDSLTTSSILDLLKKIHRDIGVTIVIITHEIGIVKRICNKMAVLDKGQVAEKGLTEDIFNKPQHEMTKKLIYLGGE